MTIPIFVPPLGEAAVLAAYVPTTTSDVYGQLAFQRIRDRATGAYDAGQDEATRRGLAGRPAHALALDAVLDAVGPAFAAAAIHQATETVRGQVDEATYLTLGDTAMTLDIEVVEDLTGANGPDPEALTNA